jgi:hypothetical protein
LKTSLMRVELRTVWQQQAQRRTDLALSSLPPRTCGALELLFYRVTFFTPRLNDI